MIVVSIMVAAFSPVITKKISNASVALSQQDSVNGVSIKSKIFNYSDVLNGVGGCTIVNGGANDGTYLKCPFEIPEGVDKLGFVLVPGGGGGAGATGSYKTMDSKFVENGNVITLNITKGMRNVTVPFLISGGGGGGGAYHYYQPHIPKGPTKSGECVDVARGSTYYNGSCIKEITDTVGYYRETKLSTEEGVVDTYRSDNNKDICWGDRTNIYFSEKLKISTTNNPSYYLVLYNKSEDYNDPRRSNICTYSAATKICKNFYGRNEAYKGRWHIVTANEANAIKDINPRYAFASSSGDARNFKFYFYECSPNNGKIGARANVIYEHDDACDRSTTSRFSSQIYHYNNICLSMYAWTSDGSYVSTKQDRYAYELGTWILNGKRDRICHSYKAREDIQSEPTSPLTIIPQNSDMRGRLSRLGTQSGGNIQIIDKDYVGMRVFCAIDDINLTPTQYHISSGGGGASGMNLAVSIPDDVIIANVGGTIEVKAGKGGAGGAKSGDGTVESSVGTDGKQGGTSYVYVKNKSNKIVWAIEVYGGEGGKGGEKTVEAKGASEYKNYFRYYNGSRWFKMESPNSSIHVIRFQRGYPGTRGYYKNLSDESSVPGGTGGAAIHNGYYGAGGKGGDARGNKDGTSADNGSDGTWGYASIRWEDVRVGAPGGGGAGGRLLKMQDIQVKEGQKFYIKVGKGGAGGVNGNGSKGGMSAFGNYYVRGGNGGLKGVNQTATAKPKGGNGGSIDNSGTSGGVLNKSGTNGQQGSVNSSNLYGTGGIGGDSGINVYLRSLGMTYADLSVGCGGYSQNADKNCYNSSNINPKFSADAFLNPGKIHRDESVRYGSAGSGGGGGGVNPDTLQNAKGLNGQDGYVYIWWYEED